MINTREISYKTKDSIRDNDLLDIFTGKAPEDLQDLLAHIQFLRNREFHVHNELKDEIQNLEWIVSESKKEIEELHRELHGGGTDESNDR